MRILLAIVVAAMPCYAQDFWDQSLPNQISIYGVISNDAGEFAANALVEISVDNGERNAVLPESFRVFRTRTNGDGYYELNIILFSGWRTASFVVGEHGFSSIRYQNPVTVNLTGFIENVIEAREMEVRFSYEFESREGWENEERMILEHGADSDKGLMVQEYGLPDRIKTFETAEGSSGELWFYYQRGFVIRFLGENEDQRFIFKKRPPEEQ